MKKAQGALEYLLLIGGAVLVAAIVIALISGLPENEQERQMKNGKQLRFAQKKSQQETSTD